MKKILFFLSFSWIFLSLSGCSSPIEAETSSEKDSDNTLVVYSPNPEDLIGLSTRLTLKTLSKRQSLPSKKNMVLRLI